MLQIIFSKCDFVLMLHRSGLFNMYVVLLFSVLHQQINCCFILALANNQNIITQLVAHGGTVFYSIHTDTQAGTQTHSHFIHACMQM